MPKIVVRQNNCRTLVERVRISTLAPFAFFALNNSVGVNGYGYTSHLNTKFYKTQLGNRYQTR